MPSGQKIQKPSLSAREFIEECGGSIGDADDLTFVTQQMAMGFEVGLEVIEKPDDDLRAVNSRRTEWLLRNMQRKRQAYEPGQALGWSDVFSSGSVAGLQILFFPRGDKGLEELTEEGGAGVSAAEARLQGRVPQGRGPSLHLYAVGAGTSAVTPFSCRLICGTQKTEELSSSLSTGMSKGSSVVKHTFEADADDDTLDELLIGVELL